MCRNNLVVLTFYHDTTSVISFALSRLTCTQLSLELPRSLSVYCI